MLVTFRGDVFYYLFIIIRARDYFEPYVTVGHVLVET